jgi:hypothetical protein
MVSFQWVTCFSESWWLGGQEFHIGASCLISSIASRGAFTVSVGHEVAQKLGLLHPRLTDGCDDLSQGRQRGRVPIQLNGLGIHTSIMSAHHAVPMSHRWLGNQVSIIIQIKHGKCDNLKVKTQLSPNLP